MKNNVLTSLRALTLLLVMCLSIGNVWGQTDPSTYSWTLASGDLGSSDSPATSVTKGTPSTKTWTVGWTWKDATKKYIGNDNTKGVQIGKGTTDYGGTVVTLSTSGISGTISKVTVGGSTANSGGGTVTVTVGTTTFKYNNNASASLTQSAATYDFTGSGSGTIVVTYTNTKTNKAIYIKSIVVTYTASSCSKNPTVSFANAGPLAKTTDDEAFTNAASVTFESAATGQTITYESDKSDVASVDENTGEVTIHKAGTAEITATAAESGDYCAASNSYTINISKAGDSPTQKVIDMTIDETTTAAEANLIWAGTYVTVTSAKNNSSSAATNYYPGTSGKSYTSTRLYSGFKFIVTPVANYTVSSVVCTATSESYANALAGATWTNATAVASSEGTTYYVTITPTNGSQELYGILSATTGLTEVVVNYGATVKSKVVYSNPTNGTLVIKNGDVTIESNVTELSQGTQLTVIAEPSEPAEYAFDSIKVIKTGVSPEEDITATTYNKSTGKITMPTYGITVSAAMKEKPSYAISKVLNPENSGTISTKVAGSEVSTAKVGKTVAISAEKASDYYRFDGFEVFKTGEESTTVTVTDNSFEMPDYAVTVKANFTKLFKVSLVTAGAGTGTATINGGTADVYVDGDDQITLVASAVAPNEFTSWSASSDDILIDDASALSTYAYASADGTITATFGISSLTPLGTPTLSAPTDITYTSVTLNWEALANAEAYNVEILLNDVVVASDVITEGTSWTPEAELQVNTTYTYTVQGVGDGITYAEENNPKATSTVTTADYPAATLTLSENSETRTYGSGLKLYSQIELPNCEVQCDKSFVGWSESNSEFTNIIAAGTSYTMNATEVTLYAVFATETPGEVTWNKVTSMSAISDGTVIALASTDGENGYYAAKAWESGNTNIKAVSATVTNDKLTSESAFAALTLKAYAIESQTYFTINDGSNYWYANGSTLSKAKNQIVGHASLGEDGRDYWTISFSGTTASIVNKVDSRGTMQYNYNSGSPIFSCYASASQNNVVIFKKTSGSPEYSDYTVTCSAKTAAPVFSLDGGAYTEAKELTITAETGAKIYYNINSDDDPTSESTEYTEAISLNTWGTKTIKAIAIADGKSVSDVVSATYVMNLPFASLEALVAQDMGSLTSATVTVSFSNVPIKSIATSYDSRVGVYFDIQKEEKDIEIYCTGVPETWQAGGKLSKSNLTCTWKRYVNKQSEFVCWELTPSSWDGFTYSDPAHITSIVISGEPTKKSYSDGQTLESDGLVVTGYYNDHTELTPHSEVITEGLTWTLPTLTEGQISAEVTVKYTEPILSTELTSEAYQVTGLSVSAAKVLQSIYVADDSEHQTKFFVGRPFSSAGLKVMAKYNIGDDEPVTPTSISTPTMTSEGEQTITITYTENEVEKQTSYDITLSYMDLNDLVAATDINDGDYVYVKFTDQQIKSFYTSGGSNKGIFFDIQKESNDIEIYANGTNCPNTWEQYGTVSATLNNVQWTKYGDIWELKPSNWDAFTYNAPNVPVTSMVVDPASTTIGEMATTTLSIVYTPSYATNKGVTWSVTEGDEYASVNATTGEVTGLKEGSATITATLTADPSITATCAVTVTATAKCVISYVVKGEEASTQTIARSEASALTYVPAAVSGHTFVGWAESDVTEETTTPVTVITEYTPGAEEANKTLYAVYKYEDTSVAGYGNYNKITAAPADWSGKYLFVSETGNCAVKGSAITSSSLSHKAVTISEGVILANDDLLTEVLEVKKGTTNYTIKGGNGMYFTYNGTSNGFSAATTGAIEYPITYDGTNKKTVITCPTSGGIPFQVNEQTSGGSKNYTFKFYASAQKAVQFYKLVEGTFYYTSYPSVKYTITFDADGGTGACPKIVVNAGENATICEDAPTKELNKFNGWSDGVNNYEAGATIENVSKDIELTAQWIAKVQYTISFDKAGAEGTTPSDITDYEGNEVTLPTKGDMSYEGYIFKGWNDGETNYAGGSKFTMPEKNVAMSAVWQDASETHWALVINEKQLKAGDKVIIVAAKYDKALAAQVETKYRSVVDITKSTDKYYVTESEDEPTTLTVGITDSKITFHDGNGYLYASSTSSNYMDVQEVLDDNGKWNVTISNGVATINSVGNTSKPMMQYNAGNPRVSCYGSKQDAGDLAIYKYYETLPEYVERNLTSANIGTSCIAQGGVEEYAFSGATFYEILNKDVDEKNVYFQEVTSLVAGMPYVFQPNAGAEQILMMVGGDEATAQSKNGLYGWLSDNYEFSSQIDSKDVYFVSGGKIVRCGNECTILKNRAYIVLSEISGQVSEAPGRRRLVLGVEGKGVATGMEEAIIMSNGELKKVVIDGQLYILRDGKVFDAQGKLVK